MAATHAEVYTILFLPLVLNMFYNISKCNLQLVHPPVYVSEAPAQAMLCKVAQPMWASNAGDDGGIDSDL
jgi:hypothetical protein